QLLRRGRRPARRRGGTGGARPAAAEAAPQTSPAGSPPREATRAPPPPAAVQAPHTAWQPGGDVTGTADQHAANPWTAPPPHQVPSRRQTLRADEPGPVQSGGREELPD